jgi:hypothetical protein
MNFIIKNIKWVMMISGALTATMLFGLFAPQVAVESMFGATFSGPLETLIIRSWSSLIGLIGIVLLYGAFNERYRVFCISIAAFSKVVFVTLVLIYGQAFLATAAPAIVMDCLVILLALAFLVSVRVQRPTA